MAEYSGVHWLFDPYLRRQGATWSLWYGCTRVSDACRNCLDPATRVLYADMTWRPIGDVQVGDELVGFTETPKRGGNRMMERTTVEAVIRTRQPTVELTVGDRTIVASPEHLWLTDQARPTWKRTDELGLGMTLKTFGFPATGPDHTSDDYRAGYVAGVTAGDGTMRWDPSWRSASLGFPQCYWRVAVLADDRAILDRLVDYLAGFGVNVEVKAFGGGPTSKRPMLKVETRRRDNLEKITELIGERSAPDWQAGWLAGIFDTDGSYSGSDKYTNLRIGQSKDNDVLAACERYAAALGYALKRENHGGCPTVRLYGRIDDQVGFLTRIVPALTRKCAGFYGRRLHGPAVEVNGVRRGPARELVDIQTSTGTFIAEGVATHNCYIFRQPPLRMRSMKFSKAGIGGKTPIVMASPETLLKPLGWRSPQMIFVNSLSDLWHSGVDIENVAAMYAVMLLARRHIFITLTKRSRRMRHWLNSPAFVPMVRDALDLIVSDYPHRLVTIDDVRAAYAHLDQSFPGRPLVPPTNVWVGVTVESNKMASLRIPDLRATPAAVKWLSVEPITDPELSLLDHFATPCTVCAGEGVVTIDGDLDYCPADDCDHGQTWFRPDWIVLGGESGPAAKATALDTEPAVGLRSVDLDHLEFLVDEGRAVDAAVYVKQLGEPWGKKVRALDRKGADPEEWPEPLRVREYPPALALRALDYAPEWMFESTGIALAKEVLANA